MIGISLIVLWSGLKLMWNTDGFFEQLSNKDPNLLTWVNPKSHLFNDWFSTYVAGFFIG